MNLPVTPVSTKLSVEIDKINQQYLEGFITANEMCCKIHSILTQDIDGIIQEHMAEQEWMENNPPSWLKD